MLHALSHTDLSAEALTHGFQVLCDSYIAFYERRLFDPKGAIVRSQGFVGAIVPCQRPRQMVEVLCNAWMTLGQGSFVNGECSLIHRNRCAVSPLSNSTSPRLRTLYPEWAGADRAALPWLESLALRLLAYSFSAALPLRVNASTRKSVELSISERFAGVEFFRRVSRRSAALSDSA